MNHYEEILEKEKRGPSANSTYGGVFPNRYEESLEKDECSNGDKFAVAKDLVCYRGDSRPYHERASLSEC